MARGPPSRMPPKMPPRAGGPSRPLVNGGLAPIFSERNTDMDFGAMRHCGQRSTEIESRRVEDSGHGGRGVSQMEAPTAMRAGRLNKLQRVLGEEAPDEVSMTAAPILGAEFEALVEEERDGASTAAEAVR